MKKIIKVLSLIMLAFAFTINFSYAQTHHKMSSRKKGALIGTGTGVVGGALISKHHRVRHAVIGGVVGGGTGYLIGRHKDKKRGRIK